MEDEMREMQFSERLARQSTCVTFNDFRSENDVFMKNRRKKEVVYFSVVTHSPSPESTASVSNSKQRNALISDL